MNLTIIIPSEEYKAYAGARIRYLRLESELVRHGVDLTLRDIGQFDPRVASDDVFVISKCHDARSLIVAAVLSQRGKLVGVDLFDDYFSDHQDSRLIGYRRWLSQLIQVCDFALCSTEAMADVVREYSTLPTHVMNDPAADDPHDGLSELLSRKLAEARTSQHIRVVWFGQGGNPYFPAGLTDLAHYGTVLSKLAQNGMGADLTVLTNVGSLTANGLSLIRELSIPVEVREWSEEAESEALHAAMLAFLPVNATAFSRAKSLNRAITALSAGCQVLSAGYPLYAPLDPLIYREVDDFLSDLDVGSPRLSPGTFGVFRKKIDALASASGEASGLAAFLSALRPAPERPRQTLSVIHGHATRGEVHRLAKAIQGLSVATPYCTASLDFDVVFRGGPFSMRMLISKDAARRLLPHQRRRLGATERIRGTRYKMLGESDGRTALETGEQDGPSAPAMLASYPHVLRQIGRRVSEAFGPSQTIISETSHLPFESDES